MNSQLTLDRRDFLKVVGTAGAGLVLGFRLPGDENNLLTVDSFSPNTFLSIDPTGSVTITVAKTEMGQGVRTSLAMIVAEELEADWSRVRVLQADAHPDKYGSQGTGGSNSVRSSFDKLSKAGCAARRMLIAAAAKQWNVDATACRAEKGFVLHASGKRLSFGELAAAAANEIIPTDITLKERKDQHLLRTRVKKLDTTEKVNGTAVYGIDVRVPNMLYASVEHAPVFGAKVTGFDAAAAKRFWGVKDVVKIETGIAVVATNTWSAFKGREALKIDWDLGPNASQSSDAIWKSLEAAVTGAGNVEKQSGDAAAALKSAATVVDALYQAPFVAHVTMEPMNCTAHYKGDSCEVWAPTQTPQQAQTRAADACGLSKEKVTLHVTHLGGGFGRRLDNDYVEEAVRISKAVNAPVKLTWKREDDMKNDHYRPATYNQLSGGIDKDGKLTVWRHRIAGSDSKGLVTGGSTPPYEIPNLLIESNIVSTGVPIGAWRSVGPSQNCFVVESFIDELAHAAKKDPFEFRKSLLPNSPRLRGVLETAALKSGWGKPMAKGRGRGIACVEAFGSAIAEVAEVTVTNKNELRIDRIVAAVDCGQYINPDTIEAQIEGAIAFALSAAMKNEITIERGAVVQSSFDTYPVLMVDEMPKVEVHILDSTYSIGGIGEPGLPPAAPAVCNAIFAAAGMRIRRLPIRF
jgi:isoquinoline 1-oxidoreductase beta subunit